MDSKCLKVCFHLKFHTKYVIPFTLIFFYLLAFAYQGKDIVFQIHYRVYSSLGDFGP
jgi:hypothetical protein